MIKRIAGLLFLIICPMMADARTHHHPPLPPPPTAANITVSTAINTPISINLSQGSSGGPTSATVIGAVTGGTETKTGALTVTFTPGLGFCGTGGFNFDLSNAYGTSNEAHVSISVQ